MPINCLVKYFGPQNSDEVSQEKGTAAITIITGANGDQVLTVNYINIKKG